MNILTIARPTSTLTTLKVQASRWGTLALGSAFPAWLSNNDAVTRNDAYQIPSWLGPILWAAPKKKTSHSKKRMRASNKGLQQKENVTACPACGNHKLMHHVCRHCYKDIKQKAKLELA
ncbi:uncharacterized protein BYT42DRAFT_587770 [Radiomyces spectabilis]|uniref:uncharacterized protein n=1 Tax=Radiomyces spectabilis TaxID=64574 RepID=UPI002220D620|nr:uncharacterized protein BYT42DRAFT_587770 [Radiomyces spectabilis]KAI8366753.1 hypothetical protein BYT42DRAFT_587770 [Radiomyces spectabilis]